MGNIANQEKTQRIKSGVFAKSSKRKFNKTKKKKGNKRKPHRISKKKRS